jgi:hypothetical protein
VATRDVTVRLPSVAEIVPPDARRAILSKLGLLFVGRVKRRTKAGLDVNGHPFAPYSVRYRENRRRAGWGTKPDLWLRGGMMGSLGVLDVDEKRVLVGFQGTSAQTTFRARSRAAKHRKTGERIDLTVAETSRRIPNALKAYWNQHGRKPRRFFALSPQDRVFLAKQALDALLTVVGQQTLTRALGRPK